MLDKVENIFKVGDTEITFCITYVIVDIGCTDTSCLDRIIYSREECKNLQLSDIAHKAWQDHNKDYATHINHLYEDCEAWEDSDDDIWKD